jgi:hypothetical protein
LAKKVASTRHKADTQAHIPSKKETGYEDANTKAQDGKKVKILWCIVVNALNYFSRKNRARMTIDFLGVCWCLCFFGGAYPFDSLQR